MTVNYRSRNMFDGGNSTSNVFTTKMTDMVNNTKKGDKIIFENIVAVGQDNITRNLPPIIIDVD